MALPCFLVSGTRYGVAMELKRIFESFGPALLGGLVGGVLTLVATWIVVEKDADYANLPYENRLTKVEEAVPDLVGSLNALRTDLHSIEGSMDTFARQGSTQSLVEPINESIASITDRLKSLEVALSEIPRSMEPVGLNELSDLIVAEHTDVLRGAKGDRGEQGPPGEAGLPGKDGKSGEDGENGTQYVLSDADVARIAAEVLASLPSPAKSSAESERSTAKEGNSDAEFVGPTDCLEFDPTVSVKIIEFKLGGAFCMNQIPVFEIVDAKDCELWISHQGSSGMRIKPSVRDSVFNGDGYTKFVYECDRTKIGDDGLPKYVFRIF
jgi:hypothetical protein